ncbi:MAG: hypothetical protein BWK80_41260 [Desulfobacteraceae bacterium IS3]|nr:MAG: hypothetical protein BWK80_41260 [Desulfobacteraceae bacterium IS3]
MTNYEQLFQNQMKDPQFAKAYYESRLERMITEMLDTLKDKIYQNEPRENLIHLIDSIKQNIHTDIARR